MLNEPIAILLILFVGLLIVAAVLVFGGPPRKRGPQSPELPGEQQVCGHCNHPNVPRASFCAHCGRPLGSHKT